LFLSGWGWSASTIGGSGCVRVDGQCERTGVQDTGDAQRAPEGPATLREHQASRIRMQVRSPTRPSSCRIGHDAELLSTMIDRDNPQQLGG
jgi:hypothetical protein